VEYGLLSTYVLIAGFMLCPPFRVFRAFRGSKHFRHPTDAR